MELDSTEAILSCVEAGLGVGFVSEWALARRAGGGALATLRLEGAVLRRSFSFVFPQGPERRPSTATHPAATMVQFLKDRLPAVLSIPETAAR
jgi:DNA-binding transcriptional LysR family regulator